MERMRTVRIHAVIEAEIPQMTPIRDLNLGLAGSKIMNRFEVIPDAKLLTWWVKKVVTCNTQYITCPKCGKIEMVCHDAVFLDGKPLCIHCSAEFTHGDLPTKRTAEDIKMQLDTTRK